MKPDSRMFPAILILFRRFVILLIAKIIINKKEYKTGSASKSGIERTSKSVKTRKIYLKILRFDVKCLLQKNVEGYSLSLFARSTLAFIVQVIYQIKMYANKVSVSKIKVEIKSKFSLTTTCNVSSVSFNI